ncbi:MAG: hypothetical protein M9892_01700 [Bacteroidetes bacterium]|nr:hypothetical protein [Bacteroidota bacterium]
MTNPQPVEQFEMKSADAFDDCLMGVQCSIPILFLGTNIDILRIIYRREIN